MGHRLRHTAAVASRGLGLALALTVTTLAAAACGDDDDGMTPPEDPNLAELVANQSDLSTLSSALDAAGLASDLEGEGPFTVFAPTNAAFGEIDADELTSDTQLLTEVLQYHVVAGQEITADEISDGQQVETLDGDTLTFSVSNGEVMVNGATVTQANVQASNGVAHVVDGVLLETVNAVQRAVLTPELSTVADAVAAAGLDETLTGDGPFTIFAPTNTAFSQIDAGELTGNSELLTEVLQFHVVRGKITASDISDGQSVNTVEGDSLVFRVQDGDVTVNDATVTLPDVEVSNGVVHVVDGVLLQTVNAVERATLEPTFSTLATAVGAANLEGTLSGSGPFTIFAPANPAFQPLEIQELTNNTSLLERILTYHVISGQRIRAGQISDGDTVQSVEGGDLAFSVSNGEVAVNGTPVTLADVRTENAVVHVIPNVLLRRINAAERVTITKDFSILQDLVGRTMLGDTLASNGPDASEGITVFAPTDSVLLAALDQNGNGSIDDGEVPSNAESILKYHVLDDVFFAGQVPTSETQVPTLEGSDVTVVRSGDMVTVNPNDENAIVTQADVDVTNGVIHAIDALLTP